MSRTCPGWRPPKGIRMKDMLAHWKKLEADAAECALIRDLATDEAKLRLYTLLSEQLQTLASEVERVITAKVNGLTANGVLPSA